MSINNALKFVREADANPDFRRKCNKLGTKVAIQEMLEEEELGFDDFDLEEAVNMMLFKCQSEEDADSIKQVQWWYGLF